MIYCNWVSIHYLWVLSPEKPYMILHVPWSKHAMWSPGHPNGLSPSPWKGKTHHVLTMAHMYIYILYVYYMYTLYVYYICIHMYTPSIVHISTTYLPLREAQSLGGPLFSGTTLVLVASSCASSVPNKPLVSSCDTCTCHICVVCYVLLYFLI